MSGTGIDVAAIVAGSCLPDDMKLEVANIVYAGMHTPRRIAGVELARSSPTVQRKRLIAIIRSFECLREIGYELESPYYLKQVHVKALVVHWLSTHARRGDVRGWLKHLTIFTAWMGCHYIVKDRLEDYVPTLADAWPTHEDREARR
jgi:hypothetical protein